MLDVRPRLGLRGLRVRLRVVGHGIHDGVCTEPKPQVRHIVAIRCLVRERVAILRAGHLIARRECAPALPADRAMPARPPRTARGPKLRVLVLALLLHAKKTNKNFSPPNAHQAAQEEMHLDRIQVNVGDDPVRCIAFPWIASAGPLVVMPSASMTSMHAASRSVASLPSSLARCSRSRVHLKIDATGFVLVSLPLVLAVVARDSTYTQVHAS